VSHPFRFSVLTLNLWNTERWAAREPALARFLGAFDPDICCFQELRSSTAAALETLLPGHRRIADPLRGWTDEGNIFYRSSLFSEAEHGAVDLEMPEPDRRFFWTRLNRSDSGTPITVCTVHLTHQENADEMATGLSYRHGQATRIVQALPGIVGRSDPALVCGDFNDPIHPARILAESGFADAFNALGLPPPATFPSQPCSEELYMNEAIDRIMFRGPLRPLLASSPRFMARGSSCSDHWPVLAVFESIPPTA
jgi:endonuclease/exonuclease/phosphatase family metal-dependent hydrolase